MALILLVEDEESVRKVMIEMLDDDHLIVEAYNGTKALSLTQKVRPNLIILDMNLNSRPEGIEVVASIRASQGMAEVPILAISGYGNTDKEAISEVMAAGATSFMAKPLELLKLGETVTKLLEEESSSPTRLALRLTNASRLGILEAIRIVVHAINGPETIKAIKAAITQFDSPAGRLEDAKSRGAE